MNRVLLLSGGMDSIALLHWIRPAIALTVDYGQICAQAEVQASAAACNQTNVRHEVLRIDCSAIGGGSMLGQDWQDLDVAREWWPFRNQLLITVGASFALKVRAAAVVLGTVQSDQLHRDGTRSFIEVAHALVSMQEGGIKVEAPAIGMSTVELIRRSGTPHDLLMWAHSCHVSCSACGRCRGCLKYGEVMNALA